MLLSSNLRKRLSVQAKRHGMEISVKLKDISVNGQKRGCSGFVTCGESCVYVSTEHSCLGPISTNPCAAMLITQKISPAIG